jgi:hypothetical protein
MRQDYGRIEPGNQENAKDLASQIAAGHRLLKI